MAEHRPIPQIPDHEVIRKIGSGAYGEVWLARTITGAWRAIKIVRREDFDDDRSFQREFEGIRHYEPVARNHAGLVHILHVGTSKEPSPFYYYVMELGDDVKTGAAIDPGKYTPRTLQTDKKLSVGTPLPVNYTLEIGIQLSGALAYLHSLDLTHRDIKPANVIFVNNHPKLADVGLVAQRDQRTFVGTEGFIPHEGPGTKRADVFALGKVLYELATGKDRLDFPELPDHFPENFDQERWLSLNHAICACCEPDIERYHIESAAKLHNILKDIKKGKPYQPPRKGLFSSPKRFMAALSGIALTFTLVLGGLYFLFPPPAENSTEIQYGSLVVKALPEGAQIFDADGTKVGDTTYGPITLPAGTEVEFTIKLDGYRPLTEKGIIEAGKQLGIGGMLVKLVTPQKGESWTDTEGMIYSDKGGIHVSNTPITASSLKKFLSTYTDRDPQSFSYSLNDGEEPVEFALIPPSEAMKYAKWLTKSAQEDGFLNHDQVITPIPITQWENWKITDEEKEKQLSAYTLQAGEEKFVKTAITTNPEGATVTLNGVELGKTPIEDSKLSPGHYSIVFKLPGYKRVESSGIVEADKPFKLHCDLVPDGSVVFNKEWTNSIGMELVPVSGTLSVSKYEIRNSDFQHYIEDRQIYPLPPVDFKQTPEHPVVGITREQARSFAHWLTAKERKEGKIEFTNYYRLPTDKEWTTFAGGTPEEGRYPFERNVSTVAPDLGKEGAPDLFPWGNTWPPEANTGNFADASARKTLSGKIIPGYKDGFSHTAPVGTYKPNSLGLYDISGNVWEWVDDDYGGTPDYKFNAYEVARGGSWESYKSQQLLTRNREFLPPNTARPDIGFRLVLERLPDERTEAENETAPDTPENGRDRTFPEKDPLLENNSFAPPTIFRTQTKKTANP